MDESISEETANDTQYTKKDLIETVKKWVQLDNQLKQLNAMSKKIRNDKKIHNQKMIDIMKANEIDNVELKDGQIQYKKYTKREPLTQKKLLEILLHHPQLQQEQVTMLNDYVYDNRKIIEKDVVVHKTFS